MSLGRQLVREAMGKVKYAVGRATAKGIGEAKGTFATRGAAEDFAEKLKSETGHDYKIIPYSRKDKHDYRGKQGTKETKNFRRLDDYMPDENY